ncbi:MAG TPA: hypothetical protein VGE16_18685 [Albitalea sp.]
MGLKRTLGLVAAVAAVAVMTGCATKAPSYQPSIQNVNVLKRAGTSAATVGTFGTEPGASGATSIQLRAAQMTTPSGGPYAQYIEEALKTELDLAQRLNPKANVVITGVLVKNNINAGGINTNDGEVEARFVVRRDGSVRFEKTKRGTAQWESSFVGNIAIPKAAQQYTVLVQLLLGALYADPDFQDAIR